MLYECVVFLLKLKGNWIGNGIRCGRGELTCNYRASTVLLAHYGSSAVNNLSKL
jgi:hypothetical protein